MNTQTYMLAILVGIALFVLYRLRGEKKVSALERLPASALPAPPPLVTPQASPTITHPVAEPPMVNIPEATIAAPSSRQRRKRTTTVVADPGRPKEAKAERTTPTPVVGLLGLLKNRNALASAFLAREIFEPPVSRRRR